MNGAPSTERLFSISCFEGLRLLRIYRNSHPDLGIDEILALVTKVEADAASLDMDAAAFLHTSVADDCPLDGEPFYQTCIKAVVVNHQPIWAKSMRQGRSRFIDSLSTDDQGVFAAAGLLQTPPSMVVVSWWDDIVGHTRLATDIEKMTQARRAEKLTMEEEEEKLIQMGIQKKPQWIGLDDNYAGYDVLSYDMHDEHEVNMMIEVKSTVASPLRFYLPRNEWKTAEEIGDAYIFHIWDMAVEPPILYVRTVEEVRPHVPSDNEKGKWSTAEIPLGT